MKPALFTRVGWFYLPCSVAGAVLCLMAGALCATAFAAVDRHSHSASDTLYGVYPFFTATFLLLDWVARRLGEAPDDEPDPAPGDGGSGAARPGSLPMPGGAAR